MKHLIIILSLILPLTLFSQFPNNPTAFRLGFQTTGDGLVHRGSGPPAYTPSGYKDARVYFDETAGDLYFYYSGNWVMFSAGGPETDPVFSLSPAFGISLGDITDWNSAHSWGDHSLAGYLTSYPSLTLDSTDQRVFSIEMSSGDTISFQDLLGYYMIWAEESAALNGNSYEWSYGNGDDTPQNEGIVITHRSKLVAVSLQIGEGSATVQVEKNGVLVSGSDVSATGIKGKAYKILDDPVAFVAGDVLNFKTISASGNSNGGRVAAVLNPVNIVPPDSDTINIPPTNSIVYVDALGNLGGNPTYFNYNAATNVSTYKVPSSSSSLLIAGSGGDGLMCVTSNGTAKILQYGATQFNLLGNYPVTLYEKTKNVGQNIGSGNSVKGRWCPVTGRIAIGKDTSASYIADILGNVNITGTLTLSNLTAVPTRVLGADATGIIGGVTLGKLLMNIDAETSSNYTMTALNVLVPVDCSSSAIEVDLPAGVPVAGDRFMVSDTRGNAATNNITIDFISAGDNLNGASVNYIMNSDNQTIEFIYINSTIGWIRK